MSIWNALSAIGCPVCHVPYHGTEKKYITYQIAGQSGTLYAEGNEAETGTAYIVNLYNTTYDASFLTTAKSMLKDAGYIVTVDMEDYDSVSKESRTVLYCVIEGADYG